jgi:putative flippase GtrA
LTIEGIKNVVLTRKTIGFLIVGSLGFLTDLLVLLALMFVGVAPVIARLLSISVAMTLTWALNRSFSFGASTRSAAQEYGRYAVIALIAAGVNYGVYLIGLQYVTPTYAMIAGSAVAMTLSFTGYDRWVFTK